MWSTHEWIDFGTRTIVVCSVLHTFLPPWEAFSDFPAAQKYYKLFVYLVGYMAGNGRSTVYKGLSTRDGQQASTVATNGKA